jgi:hypothetical protein
MMVDPTPHTDPDRFTVRELIEEAQREVAMRRNLYEKQVRAGRMSREQADRQIDLMEAIVRRLTRTAAL